VRHFYYSPAWQVLEERIDSSSNAESQNIFGARYIDELILRDRDTDDNGSLDERLYYLQDANFNVTTLTDDTGDAVERYNYMPYGEVDVLDADFTSDADGASDVENAYLFTGRKLDFDTDLYYFRNRDYHTLLGRFLSHDHLGYVDSMNLTEYVVSNPVMFSDPSGALTKTASVYWRIKGVGDWSNWLLGRNGLVLEVMAFSNDGCTIVSGQMVVRQFWRSLWRPTRSSTGPLKVIKESENCPCPLECVVGTATGSWTARKGIGLVSVRMRLSSKLRVEVCADGSSNVKENHDVSTTFGIYDNSFQPRDWHDKYGTVPDWSSGNLHLK